jgi:hypothetical protein
MYHLILIPQFSKLTPLFAPLNKSPLLLLFYLSVLVRFHQPQKAELDVGESFFFLYSQENFRLTSCPLPFIQRLLTNTDARKTLFFSVFLCCFTLIFKRRKEEKFRSDSTKFFFSLTNTLAHLRKQSTPAHFSYFLSIFLHKKWTVE